MRFPGNIHIERSGSPDWHHFDGFEDWLEDRSFDQDADPDDLRLALAGISAIFRRRFCVRVTVVGGERVSRVGLTSTRCSLCIPFDQLWARSAFD
jgi:hypothetical protein